jgi:hypothetical protein
VSRSDLPCLTVKESLQSIRSGVVPNELRPSDAGPMFVIQVHKKDCASLTYAKRRCVGGVEDVDRCPGSVQESKSRYEADVGQQRNRNRTKKETHLQTKRQDLRSIYVWRISGLRQLKPIWKQG